MSGSKVPNSLWLNNFYKGLNWLIDDEINAGKTVTGVIMSEGVYDKLSEALGYNPTDVLGYVLEVLESDVEIEGAEDIIIIKGNTLN